MRKLYWNKFRKSNVYTDIDNTFSTGVGDGGGGGKDWKLNKRG